ncbi:MAG: Holliday junction branch migration protein RuvA [Bacteroidota bacterium]|nr:Holliday junction branch migration protein RuvA [Bacteroidota bacterium]
MIASIRGKLVRKDFASAIVDVGGVGFAVAITLQTYEKLPTPGSEVELLTHLHVRDDALQLFGFLDEDERSMFRLLQGITGIGTRTALNILSGCGPTRLRELVAASDISALTSIPGIGRKTAERIILELRDTFAKEPGIGIPVSVQGTSDARSEAILALVTLGFSKQNAEKAIRKALDKLPTNEQSASNLIKTALQIEI